MAIPATYQRGCVFLDRTSTRASGAIAIECEEEISYADIRSGEPTGSALRTELGVRREERVLLLTLDGPEMVFAFFGAIKIGAVPIPTNTLWTAADCELVLCDSRAVVAIISAALYPRIAEVFPRCPWVRHVVVVGAAVDDRALEFEAVIGRGVPELPASHAADEPDFWLYLGIPGRTRPVCICTRHARLRESYARRGPEYPGVRPMFQVRQAVLPWPRNACTSASAEPQHSVPGAVTKACVYGTNRRYRTTLLPVPTHYAMCWHPRRAREFDRRARCGISAGESLPPAI